MFELSDEHTALAFTVSTRGWEELFKPRIAQRAQEYYELLLDPAVSRKEKMNDDYLRGAIAALKWVVTWPDLELNAAATAVQEANREAAANEQQPFFGGPPPNGHGGSNGNSRF